MRSGSETRTGGLLIALLFAHLLALGPAGAAAGEGEEAPQPAAAGPAESAAAAEPAESPAPPAAPAGAIPERAVCQVCQARGGAHGAEEVAAWMDHDGRRYFFCSRSCHDAFAAHPAAFLPPVLPRPAPAAPLASLEGGEVRVEDLRGKVVLLDFWATWCKPCIEAMPKLESMHTELSESGFALLGISIDEGGQDGESAGGAETVRRFLQKKRVGYPLALDAGDPPAWQRFGVAAIPAMFLLDRDGQIVAQWTGKIDLGEVREAVENLIAAGAAEG